MAPGQTVPGAYPPPDARWIEDRFWVWVHYAALKIARGELQESFDFLSYLRVFVLGPLGSVRAGRKPIGVRRVEDDPELAARLAELGASPLKTLRTVGGGAANEAWTRIREKLLTVRNVTPLSEHAAVGAARLAWRGIGHDPY